MPDTDLEYGFRYDPMEWVENNDSFKAAVARHEVLGCPSRGDAELIRKHLDDAFPESMARVRRGELPGACWFISSAGVRETKTLADTLLAVLRERGKEAGVYELQLMVLAGVVADPLVVRGAQRLAAQVLQENPWHGCQRGPFEKLQALLGIMDVDEVARAADYLMSAIEEKINAAGFTGKGKTPYGQVALLAYTDHPAALRILRKTIPFILAAQAPGGGWHTQTLAVLRSLQKAGLSGELRLGVAGDHLAVLARSFDPRCRADAPEWKGRNLDVYVAEPGERTVRQFVFFASSPKGDGRLEAWELGKKRETPEFLWRIVPRKPFGYEVHALIPLSECLLDPDADEFLVDMAVVAPARPGEKPKFTLLFTGPSARCAFRNNRYYALAVAERGTGAER